MRLGLEPDLSDFLNKDGRVPACFDTVKLVPLRSDVIEWLDKVHNECECFISDYCEGPKKQQT